MGDPPRPFGAEKTHSYLALVGAVGIESTTLLEIKEFCGAAWPSRVLKGIERNP
jgi:hypothetical protein